MKSIVISLKYWGFIWRYLQSSLRYARPTATCWTLDLMTSRTRAPKLTKMTLAKLISMSAGLYYPRAWTHGWSSCYFCREAVSVEGTTQFLEHLQDLHLLETWGCTLCDLQFSAPEEEVDHAANFHPHLEAGTRILSCDPVVPDALFKLRISQHPLTLILRSHAPSVHNSIHHFGSLTIISVQLIMPGSRTRPLLPPPISLYNSLRINWHIILLSTFLCAP